MRLAPAAAALLAFGVVLGAPPVYDDQAFLEGNPFHRLAPRTAAAALVSRDYLALSGERSWQPLVSALSYASGGRPAPVRAAALAAHAACAVLVSALALSLGAAPAAAAAGGLLFALFPPSAEPLAVASFSGHVFALLGVLASSLLWVQGRTLPAAAVFALALTAKETALAVLPAAALLAWARGLPARRLLPLAGVAAAYALWRWGLLRPPPPLGGTAYPFSWTLPWESFGFQLRHLAWPAPLCLERSFDPGWERALRLLLPAAWAALLWRWRGERTRTALLLWLPAAALPVLHLVPFANYSPAADRYLYGPAAAACALAALWAGERRRRAAALAALALAWGVLAVRRAGQFRDPDVLSAQTAACAPGHPRALALRASWLYGRGDAAGAGRFFESAFALAPGLRAPFREPGLRHEQGRAYVTGLMRLRAGDPAGAVPLFAEAAAASPPGPARAAALARQGESLGAAGDVEAGSRLLAAAAAELPGWPPPVVTRGVLLESSGGDGLELLLDGTRAAAGDPEEYGPFLGMSAAALGDAYARRGRWPDAAKAWSVAASSLGEPGLWARAAEAREKAGEDASGDWRRALEEASGQIARLEAAGSAGEGARRALSGIQERARSAISAEDPYTNRLGSGSAESPEAGGRGARAQTGSER